MKIKHFSRAKLLGLLVLQQHRFDGYRAIQGVQDKAWVEGNGNSLVETHNAVLSALGCSLRASYEAVIRVVAPFVKGTTIPCKTRLAANHFITRCTHQTYIVGVLVIISWLGIQQNGIAATTLDKIAAVVDNDVIMVTDVRTHAISLKKQKDFSQLPEKALIKEALEQLILDSIQIQRANQIGLSIGDSALNTTMQNLAQQNKLTLEQFREALKREGMDYAVFRERIRKRLLINELRKRQLQRNTKVTNQEVSDLIANQSEDLTKGVEYKIQKTLIPAPTGTSLDNLLKAKADAEKMRVELLNNKNKRFADQTTISNWTSAQQLPPSQLRHIALLEVGQISDVFQDSKGFHIVKLVDKRGAKKVIINEIRARHILLKTSSKTTDNALKNKLAEIRNKILAGADFADLAKQNSQDPGSAVSGGDLGWSTPDAYVPEFARVLQSTPVNQISQPFKSKFGWHILQVQEKKALDRTEDVLRNQAKNLLNKSKAEKEYESWVKQLRNDAFVEYRIKL